MKNLIGNISDYFDLKSMSEYKLVKFNNFMADITWSLYIKL